MALPVLILGESGTGKSTSLRNLNKENVLYINVEGKPLPFKGKFTDTVDSDSYDDIKRALKNTDKKIAVIDDSQYLMGNEFMRRAKDKGFDKFTEIGQAYWELINSIRRLPNDLIVYILSHIDTDANGKEKAKTIGKMLDEKITVEGMFTIVLGTKVEVTRDGNKYYFVTQNNGSNTLKSPMGMFDSKIDNDLAFVDKSIRDYYDLSQVVGDTKAVAEAPRTEEKNLAEKLAEDVKAPEPPKRRSRREAAAEEEPVDRTKPLPTDTIEFKADVPAEPTEAPTEAPSANVTETPSADVTEDSSSVRRERRERRRR